MMRCQIHEHVIYGSDINKANPLSSQKPLISIEGMVANGMGSHLQISEDQLLRGMGLIGGTGTGKTHLLKEIVRQLKNHPGPYSMVVIQAKNDFDELLEPGDLVIEQGNTSSVRWNVFSEILRDGGDDESVKRNSLELSNMLLPEKKGTKEPFFIQGARILLQVVLLYFIKKAKNNLEFRSELNNRSLLNFFLDFDEASYKELLNENENAGALRMVLGEDSFSNLQALGVYGELITNIRNYLVDIFADEDGDFSIGEFVKLKQRKTLFINYDPEYKDSQRVVYGALVKIALKTALSQNSTDGKVFLICDELPAMGKTDIAEAVNLGRAKGLVTIVGMQSVSQVYSIYGEHEGNTLLAGLTNKIWFRPNDEITKNKMVSEFGRCIVDRFVFSPGGTRSERCEKNMIEDRDIDSMSIGDCYASLTDNKFRFHVEY